MKTIRYQRLQQDAKDVQSTKPCGRCKKIMLLSNFGVDNSRKNGIMSTCKLCLAQIYRKINKTLEWRKKRLQNQKKFSRTPKGVLTHIFTKQKETSKARSHPPPQYSLQEFHAMFLKDKKFNRLFNEWEKSGYVKDKRPSIDRINCKIGYSFDNIHVLTWKENRFKQRMELQILEGKTIYQILDGEVIASFKSATDVKRKLGIDQQSSLSRACQQPWRTCAGFHWSYHLPAIKSC